MVTGGDEPIRAAAPTVSVTSAYDAAERLIEQSPDLDQAFKDATDLVAALLAAYNNAAGLRARLAAGIRQRHGLTFAQLATRLDLSKSRTGQLLARASRDAA